VHESCHTYEWVMSHVWMSHVTCVNESCYTCEWVVSLGWMSHVTRVNESCHTCEWVMSHVWMSHVTRVNESCHSCEWVMSHVWVSRVTRVNESCLTNECVTAMGTTLRCKWKRVCHYSFIEAKESMALFIRWSCPPFFCHSQQNTTHPYATYLIHTWYDPLLIHWSCPPLFFLIDAVHLLRQWGLHIAAS